MYKTAVVYADSLLIVNFSMDFLALYITARLLHISIRPLKFMLGAVIGSAWAFASVFIDSFTKVPMLEIFMIAVNGACAVFMVLIAFGVRGIAALKAAMTYIAVNVGLGGIMTALYSFISKTVGTFGEISVNTTPDASPLMFCTAAAISGAVSLLYGRIRSSAVCRRQVELTIIMQGHEIVTNALCDSGNLLREPFSGKPVIVLCADSIKDILPNELLAAAVAPDLIASLPIEMSHKMRLIPAGTVMGQGMLLCFLPDRICVDGRAVDAVAAIDANTVDYDGCGGIIPQSLLDI